MSIKITELETTRSRTSYQKDQRGNRQRIRTPYKAKRKVKAVEGGKRFAHFFIDALIFGFLTIPFDYALSFIDYQPQTIGLSLSMSYFPSYLLYALYYFIFESISQSTPGKMLTNTLVINEYGQKPSRNELIVRSLIRLVPFEAFSCLSERRWHDRWSKTWVISKEENQKIQAALNKHKEMMSPKTENGEKEHYTQQIS